MVLGVKWLKSLGPIIWDFSQLTMKFMHEGKGVELVGLGLKGLTIEDSHKSLINSVSKGRGLFLQLMEGENGEKDIQWGGDV